jgi:hypothetical protein
MLWPEEVRFWFLASIRPRRLGHHSQTGGWTPLLSSLHAPKPKPATIFFLPAPPKSPGGNHPLPKQKNPQASGGAQTWRTACLCSARRTQSGRLLRSRRPPPPAAGWATHPFCLAGPVAGSRRSELRILRRLPHRRRRRRRPEQPAARPSYPTTTGSPSPRWAAQSLSWFLRASKR